jgi:hypothetical protein
LRCRRIAVDEHAGDCSTGRADFRAGAFEADAVFESSADAVTVETSPIRATLGRQAGEPSSAAHRERIAAPRASRASDLRAVTWTQIRSNGQTAEGGTALRRM